MITARSAMSAAVMPFVSSTTTLRSPTSRPVPRMSTMPRLSTHGS